MNCRNCGAPMVLHRERDYYHCEYCGSFHFPNNSAEGIRLLGENPEGIKCPLCGIPFQMATFDDHYRGYQCSKCQGVLFTRSTFRQTIETRRAKATTPPEPPSRYESEELRRRLDCPICSRMMSTHQYMGPGNIIIDTCNTCNLIWLDYRELDKVVNAPGKDRGAGMEKQEEDREEDKEKSEISWKKRKKKKKYKKKRDTEPFSKNLLEMLDDLFD